MRVNDKKTLNIFSQNLVWAPILFMACHFIWEHSFLTINNKDVRVASTRWFTTKFEQISLIFVCFSCFSNMFCKLSRYFSIMFKVSNKDDRSSQQKLFFNQLIVKGAPPKAFLNVFIHVVNIWKNYFWNDTQQKIAC